MGLAGGARSPSVVTPGGSPYLTGDRPHCLAGVDGYMRSNPTGEAPEGWFRPAGCRRWTHLRRDRTSGEWR